MPDPAPIDILLDILELIERIERQTAGLTREASYRTQTSRMQRHTAFWRSARRPRVSITILAAGAPHPDPLPAKRGEGEVSSALFHEPAVADDERLAGQRVGLEAGQKEHRFGDIAGGREFAV